LRLAPFTEVDRFIVEGVLGEGGMAVVYKVRHATLGTHYALKVLSTNDRDLRRRLLREGRIQALMRHPNLVAVHDVISVNDAPALVMDYIPGPPLNVFLKVHKLTVDQGVAIARGITAGMSLVHDAGLIHRDLKPGNVLLDIHPTGLVPRVTDFGIGKIQGERRSSTKSGITLGTPRYMAPEQITDAKTVDQRADIFSIGVVLYETVCGQKAFAGNSAQDVFQAILHGRFPRPSHVNPDVPPHVERIILGAMSTDRRDRISSCGELLDLLDSSSMALQGQIVNMARSLGTGDSAPNMRELLAQDLHDDLAESIIVFDVATVGRREVVHEDTVQLEDPVSPARTNVSASESSSTMKLGVGFVVLAIAFGLVAILVVLLAAVVVLATQ
jgi:serine/threonine protein kinase